MRCSRHCTTLKPLTSASSGLAPVEELVSGGGVVKWCYGGGGVGGGGICGGVGG